MKPVLYILIPLLLLVIAAEPAEANRKRTLLGRPADAVEVFRCDFDDETWDINYDKWPDGWSRHEGPGYPHYVEVEIADDPTTDSGRCLRMGLDAAQAKVTSPFIPVLPKFSYWLELKVKIEQAPESDVYVQFEYLNSKGEVRQSFREGPLKATGKWTTIETGSIRPKHSDIDRAVVTFETEKGERGDLNGVVSIADLWMARMPTLAVSANNPFHIYTDPRDVVITCSLSGINERNPEIRFQLLDASERKIGAQSKQTLDGREIVVEKILQEDSRSAADIVMGGMDNLSKGFEGSTEWRPEIEKHGSYGFYQVRVEMLSNQSGKLIDNRIVTLAVIPPPAIDQARGEFGWGLPMADKPLSFSSLEKVLPLVGVNWIKLPIWFKQEQVDRGEEILQFAERLAASDIETIGVIEHPQAQQFVADQETVVPPEGYAVANVFGGDPSSWMPLYDHIMTRLSLRIRWWQLGGDRDTSFVGYDDLVDQVRGIRNRLYRFGQDVNLGLGWRWDTPLEANPTSWEFHQMSANPPLTAEELDEKLGTTPRGAKERWVLIEPVVTDPTITSADELHIARVRDLVKKIVVAKRHGADGIFAPNPFSGANGLMTREGKPGELLLPWRTAATLLGDAEYMGQLRLPKNSSNWLFRRSDGKVVMVLWNDTPGNETLFLGDDIMMIDVWGKRQKPTKEGYRDSVPVGPLPRFVVGLNEAVARWRMSVDFEHREVPSIFEYEHLNALTFRNTFGQGIGGTVRIFVPDVESLKTGVIKPSGEWKVEIPSEDFGLPGKGQYRLPMEVRLNDAQIGPQPVRIDFQVAADRVDEQYRFSVWRDLEVGLGDIHVEIVSKLDERGRLVVQQQMSNTSGELMSFKCFLTVKGRRRKRAQVFQLGPEPDIKLYTYSKGQELMDNGAEIELRAEEIDGPRVLIQKFGAAK